MVGNNGECSDDFREMLLVDVQSAVVVDHDDVWTEVADLFE